LAPYSWRQLASSFFSFITTSILDLLYLNVQIFKFVINIWFLYYFIYFSTYVQYIFLNIYFKNITDEVTDRTIPFVYSKDSWKRIVANIITTVNSLTDEIIDDILSVIFCIYRWIYRHTNKNFDDITYVFLVYDMLNLPMDIPTE